MSARYIVGIDLGTTNTVVAFADTRGAGPSAMPRAEVFPLPQWVAAGEVAGQKGMGAPAPSDDEYDFEDFDDEAFEQSVDTSASWAWWACGPRQRVLLTTTAMTTTTALNPMPIGPELWMNPISTPKLPAEICRRSMGPNAVLPTRVSGSSPRSPSKVSARR